MHGKRSSTLKKLAPIGALAMMVLGGQIGCGGAGADMATEAGNQDPTSSAQGTGSRAAGSPTAPATGNGQTVSAGTTSTDVTTDST